MTWVLIFWHKVWNCCPERYGKFQSEIPSTSGAICEKPQGGPLGPPAGRGLTRQRARIYVQRSYIKHDAKRTYRASGARVHCQVTHWAWIRLKICGNSENAAHWSRVLLQRGTADGNDQVNMGKHLTLCTAQSGIRSFTTYAGSVKRFQKSTLGGKRMSLSKIYPLFFAHQRWERTNGTPCRLTTCRGLGCVFARAHVQSESRSPYLRNSYTNVLIFGLLLRVHILIS